MLALANRPGRSRLSRPWVLLAAAVAPTLAPAQQPAATGDELTQAILRYAFRYLGGNARLIPGQVPDDLAPNFHAPPGTRILGTVITNAGAVVFASTTTPAESLRAEYLRALGPRGWKAPETMSRSRGFVPSPSDLPVLLCRGESQLHVQHTHRAAGTLDLQLEYRDGSGMCESMSAPVVRFQRDDGPQFPTLYAPAAPAGMSMANCSSRFGRRGGSSMSTSTIVPTDLSAVDLLRHYGRQLETAGWRAPTPSAGPPFVTGTWLRTDTADTSTVTLEVSQASPSSRCYGVSMRVAR
jgi:hypothetical protein